MFCKIMFKVFAFKIEFTFLVTMWSIIYLVYRFTKPWLRKNLCNYSEKKQSKKTPKIPRNPEAATGDALEKELVSECRKVHR